MAVFAFITLAALIGWPAGEARAFLIFGGDIIGIIPPIPYECWVPRFIIGPPRPMVVGFSPGISRVYRHNSLKPGSKVLGSAIPVPGLCSAPIITMVGTSF